ncbi:MAG: NAD-dependent epimerase/dehydratase family protein [Acidimicrobiales bacterium]
MRVLVTGGSGFTGGFVVRELVGRGHDVVALARSGEAADVVRAAGAENVWGDLDDPQSIDVAFADSKADALVNVASLGFGHTPVILAAAENGGIRRAVFVSTTAIFTTLPAPSKAVRVAAEDSIMASDLDWTIIRPTMIYGAPGDRNVERLVRLARRSPALPLPGGGAHLQQPVHVADLAAAIVTAVERDVAIGNAYDVAGPVAITFREIVEQTQEACGRGARTVALPVGPVRRLVAAQERLLPRPRLKVEQMDRLEEDKVFDIEAARRDLGHDPRSFREGLADLVAAP